MSFEVNCPACRKAYSADAKMVGKRIRCRQCTQVFVVESPDSASSSSSTMGRDASRAGSGVATARATATAASVIARPPTEPSIARPAPRRIPPSADSLGLQPSEPQPFPASAVLEAWIPLALCVISAAWVLIETFTDNHSGAAWAPVVRILAFVAVYFLLVVPATLVGSPGTELEFAL